MPAFIGVIVYGLSVMWRFSSTQQYFFSVCQGFHSSAKDQGSQSSSVSAPSAALTSNIVPVLRLSLAGCEILLFLTLFLQSHCVCCMQTPLANITAVGKYIKVVKENILHSRNSTES